MTTASPDDLRAAAVRVRHAAPWLDGDELASRIEALANHLNALEGPPWRVGRKVGRTIYKQLGAEPSDDDILIGVMDSPEIAAVVVGAVNASSGRLPSEGEQ